VVTAADPDVTLAFLDAMAANQCAVFGPGDAAATLAAIVERVCVHTEDGTAVALPVGDPTLDDLGVADALVAAGRTLLRPDDPDWFAGLVVAGVGVTTSIAAVAATGNVALRAGAGLPRATSLLPPAHVCIVRASQVHPTFADAITALLHEGPLPSALTWIGGPSRTGDLEMRTTFGVHGPKVVDIVLLDD
jgi:L-lactate dehydrogenase complex protein LldG